MMMCVDKGRSLNSGGVATPCDGFASGEGGVEISIFAELHKN